MNTYVRVVITCLFFCSILFAQYDVSIEEKTSHLNWGESWGKVYVAQNNLVTLAVVPDLGGRVMQYDLGDHPSIYVHGNLIGTLPVDGNEMVGGFRMLPSPQSDFGWPSPPEVDLNPYTCTVVTDNADSTVIHIESQVVSNTASIYETHQGMQFKRQFTLYRASTRVKVEMTMLNTGNTSMEHGIWDITQTNCSNNGSVDPENIWVYFKRNPSSAMTDGYIEYPDQADQNANGEEKAQWKPDVAEGGIMGVQYLQKQGKIGADCSAGWICHVDRLDGYAYVKTFTYGEGKNYPDGGASVQVYTYSNTPTVEVEVLGPLTTLEQNDSVKMVENWYMARSHGPVLDVNDAGLITKRLSIEKVNTELHADGTYGVFHPGTVYAQLLDASDNVLSTVDSFALTPDDSLRFEQQLPAVENAVKLQLALHAAGGEIIGILDTATLPPFVGIAINNSADKNIPPVSLKINTSVLQIINNHNSPFLLELFSINGQRIASLPVTHQKNLSLPLSDTGLKTFIVRFNSDEITFSRVMHTIAQ